MAEPQPASTWQKTNPGRFLLLKRIIKIVALNPPVFPILIRALSLSLFVLLYGSDIASINEKLGFPSLSPQTIPPLTCLAGESARLFTRFHDD